MVSNLVIVESPAKAKTINKYLGKDYSVLASFGHIRDLPSKNGSVRPDEDFAMDYEINDKAKKHVQDIVKACSGVNNIFLASDPDREGEAIAWHVVEALKIKKVLKKDINVKRVVFNEITKKAVNDAFKHPRDIDMNLVNAQQARRALDYLVGFTLSPILWRKLPGSRSAGRVQSVALRLICERDYEIEKFVSREYWSIVGDFLNTKNQDFSAKLVGYKQKKLDKFDLANETQVKEIESDLLTKKYQVVSVEKKRMQRNPAAPFITSTLQQEASRKLGFGASRTMQIAQKLYEGIEINGETIGLITYMRTDGVSLSEDAVVDTRNYIAKNYGDKYIPSSPRIYKSKVKNAQEAHEAIRPTNINLSPDMVESSLTPEQFKLYDLIWKRMIACQMQSAEFDQTSVNIEALDKMAEFRASGSIMVFDGYNKVYSEGKDDVEDEDEEKKLLPIIENNELVNLDKISSNQHFTEPPPRYTEASLVKKMEELGIGRPSTYASIISVLQEREYVRLEKKRFFSEDRGKVVTAFLLKYFQQYVEYDFTADLEHELDVVSSGEMDWKSLLHKFWNDFIVHINSAQEQKNLDINNTLVDYLVTNLALKDYPKQCNQCNKGVMQLRIGKFGLYYSCSEYPECKHTIPFSSSQTTEAIVEDNNKLLGKINEQDVYLKKGPYGFYFQMGEGKNCKRSALPKFIEPGDANIEIATKLFSLPIIVGKHPEDQLDVIINLGRFGPYVGHNGSFYSIPKAMDFFSIDLDTALEIMSKPKKEKTVKTKPAKEKAGTKKSKK